jgi:hypothetical protein
MHRLCTVADGHWMEIAVIFKIMSQAVRMLPGLPMRNGISPEPSIAAAYVRNCGDADRHAIIE